MFSNDKKAPAKVILSVTNDIISDQRLHKIATSLLKLGLQPCIVGIKFKNSLQIEKRVYQTRRFRMLFKKGPLFYAEFNFRLFIYLIFKQSNILISNDLDTLLATYLAYKIKHIFRKNVKLVYDSHELFTELPELNGRPRIKRVWIKIEKLILPKIRNSYTVCDSISEYYNNKYKIKMQVIRNMPTCNQESNSPISIKLPADKKIILYQGALNIGRGIEQVIDLMTHIDNSIFVIAGSGNIEQQLKERVREKKLENKVIFLGKLPFEHLNSLTKKADIGLILQEDICLSYHYCLPNRLFDFIKAGVPVVSTSQPEIIKIVECEQIGYTVNSLNDITLPGKIKTILTNDIISNTFKTNIKKCRSKYCWENEEDKLFNIFQNLR
jgi:glycosyltransferase involved in cell wall biosynthesis